MAPKKQDELVVSPELAYLNTALATAGSETTLLRTLAGSLWAARADIRTVEKLAATDIRLQVIPLADLKRWRIEDDWDAARTSMQQIIAKEIQAKFGGLTGELIQNEIRLMSEQAREMDAMLADPEVKSKVKSYEGLMAQRREHGKRLQELVAEAGRILTTKNDDPLAGVELSDDEKEHLAASLLEYRNRRDGQKALHAGLAVRDSENE